MKKTLVIIFSLVIFITGCFPPESEMQPAITQTQTTQPMNNDTRFSMLNFESLLISNGDLPNDFEAGEFLTSHSYLTEGINNSEYHVMQEFIRDDRASGFVEVSVFKNSAEAANAIKIIFERMPANSSSKSEKDMKIVFGSIKSFNTYDYATLSWQICEAIVNIEFWERHSSSMNIEVMRDSIMSYSSRLESRLIPFLCREPNN